MVAISSYPLGSGGWNGTTTTQLPVVIAFSPDQRAMHSGLLTTGHTIPLHLPILEATMRTELLNNVLPERVQTTSMQKGATTVLDLLFITFQTYLPSKPSARVEGLTTVEAPLRASKNFQEALTTLRSWRLRS